MIISLTDAEALALSQQLRIKTASPGDALVIGEGVVESAAVNAEALASAMDKVQAAMQKSDAKLARSLDYAISSLESSGFDTAQLAALTQAKNKAALHNESKYEAKDKAKSL